ncbi:MAG: hypothetical protein H0W96_06040 [Solirubrobacterales bacterium]|nr:hypothetical protein [Solirubrobacterales bacterium]
MPPAAVVPSNVFTITTIKTTSTRTAASLKLSIQVPGAGSLSAVATSSYKLRRRGKPTRTVKVKIGSVTGKATAAGAVQVTIKVSAAGMRALRRAKRLVIVTKVTFTPTGGTARTLSKNATLKVARARR